MTQQDLIRLTGLRSTDPMLLAHFEQYGLAKPPKSLTSNSDTKIIYDKERNLYYAFSFNICNDQFYPPIDVGGKHADYKFAAFLSEISFLYKDPTPKKPDPKEAAFWNITPSPQAPPTEIASWFAVPEKDLDDLFLEKQIGDNLVIKASYDRGKKLLTGTRVSIIQHSELISHYFLDKNSELLGHKAHLYAMLLKWLYDNRYLAHNDGLYQNELPADADAVLAFAKQHLKSHLWDNQISTEAGLRSFLFTSIHNFRDTKDEQGEAVDFYFRDIILRQAGKLEVLEQLHAGQKEEEKELFRSILFNEQTYQAFYQEMNRQFDYFKTLSYLK